MTQGEAVYIAVRAVFSELDIIPATGTWSADQKERVFGMLLTSFRTGQWAKNSGGQDNDALLKYIPSLVNNHVRKDLRLNGGVKYEAKNPGSRSGSGDESVKAMRALLAITTDAAAKVAIQAEIDKRVLELKPKVEIKVDALPESLRHLVVKS